MTEYINVIVDVPIHAKEAVTRNEDGGYSVFINPQLCQEAQEQAYRHALYHIEHHFNGEDVQTIEEEAHEKGGYTPADT